MKCKVVYYKANGKYYTESEFDCGSLASDDTTIYEAVNQFKSLCRSGHAPGIIGFSALFFAVVSCEGHFGGSHLLMTNQTNW